MSISDEGGVRVPDGAVEALRDVLSPDGHAVSILFDSQESADRYRNQLNEAMQSQQNQSAHPQPASAPVGVENEPGAVRALVAAANAVLALYPHDDQLWTLESAVRPFNATRPAECSDGCPPQQVCDYCQIASFAQQPAVVDGAALASIKWTGQVYPNTDADGAAVVCMEWGEFNAMRVAAGLKALKPVPHRPAQPQGEKEVTNN